MSSFVQKGKKKTLKPNVSKPCLLDLANDWKMVIDFDGSIPFPINEVPCTERPDIVIYSVTKRIVIWGELTVPREERILASAIKKKKKYTDLKIALTVKEWTVYDLMWEVGALGFIGHSVRSFLQKLGFPKGHLNSCISRIGSAARRSSHHIWHARHSPTWNPPHFFKLTPSIAFPPPQPSSSPIRPGIAFLTQHFAPPHCHQTLSLPETPPDFDLEQELSIEESIQIEPPPSPPAPHRSPWNIFD